MNSDQLRQEVDRLREIVREQGETIEQQDERIDELEREHDNKDAQELVDVRTDEEVVELSDVWIAGLPFGKVLNTLKTIVRDDGGLIDRLIDLEETSTQTEQTDEKSPDDRVSPLAQTINLPVEHAQEVLTANQQRGRKVAQRARELGTNTRAGLVVHSSDIAGMLRREGESAHSETVSRVMDFINRLGKDDVESKLYKGKRILVFDPDRVTEYGKGPEPDLIRSHRDVMFERTTGPDPAPA